MHIFSPKFVKNLAFAPFVFLNQQEYIHNSEPYAFYLVRLEKLVFQVYTFALVMPVFPAATEKVAIWQFFF